MGKLVLKNSLRLCDAVKMWYDFCEEYLQDFAITFESNEGASFRIDMPFPAFDGDYQKWFLEYKSIRGDSAYHYLPNSFVSRLDWVMLTVVEVISFINTEESHPLMHIGNAVKEGIFNNLSITMFIYDNSSILRNDAEQILENLKNFLSSQYELDN